MENPNFSNKVNDSLKHLSQDRREEIMNIIIQTLSTFRQNEKFEEGKIYPFELTYGFDKEEPTQYVYVKCAFALIEQTIAEGDSIPRKVFSTKLNFEDLQIFKKEEMFEWLDHVNRINKDSKREDSLHSENTIFKKEDSDKTNKPKDEKEKTVQSNIRKSIIDKNPNSPFNQKPNLPKGFFKKLGENEINPENILETNINQNSEDDENDIFDFWDEEMPEFTEEEYLETFRLFSKNAINSVMEGTIISNFFTDETEITKMCLIDSLKDLQHKFSNCDFWKFKKETLLDLGFMNFANKILLIPIWAYPVVHVNGFGRLLAKKDGGFDMLDEDLEKFDFTNCYGCYGFGIPIKDLGKIN